MSTPERQQIALKKPTISAKKRAPNCDIQGAMNQKYSDPAALSRKSSKTAKKTNYEVAPMKTFKMENSRECYSNLLSEEYTKKLGVFSQVRVAPDYSTVLIPSAVARHLYYSTIE